MSTEKVHDTEKGSIEDYREEHHVDLANNVNARIQNPLHGIPKAKLMAQVEQFAREKGMEEQLPYLRKGALLAQNPKDFENIPELDEEDRAVIRREVTHKWSQPKDMYKTVIICSIAAAVQGWDQEGSNGANLSFPDEFGISDDASNPDASKNEWLIGLINSGPYIGAALIGCWLTDPLNILFGRRGTIFICGIFCTLTVIGSACAQTWPQLLVCRLLLGIGMGAKASTVPVFAAENTPASIRGGLVMSWQLWTAFGIFLGVSANLALADIGKIAWRLQLGSAFLPAIPLVLFIYSCPESPRWYMKKGRYHDAYNSLKRLRNSELQAAKDLYYVHRQLEEEFAIIKGSNYFSRFFELFTIPRVRRATLASFVVMIAQQMCGINIIAFYSSSIFVEAGYTEKQALLASFGFGLVNFVFAFPAVWTIDTFGRRNLLLFTFPNMAWTLLCAGLCFLIPSGNSARVPLIALFIFIFDAFYSPGEGPVPFTYSAEVFPLTHREMGMSWAVATCLFWAAILSMTFPRMLGALGPEGSFGFYAGLNVLAFFLIFFLLPETKQRTLEELDYVFAVPTSKHIAYQGGTFLPFWIKKWIFWQRDAELKPLYNFDEVESITVFEKGAGH
ncbi:hypothetical protein EV361DRAFT_936800 [Lentinula raphanica]|uniref:Major facilitator superfamily (MFS) profile domain-containing protein n=1 Tax=Lentinula raphanica TaxID=153919 RepID=A0AA38P039_9AGAR|nr:hypothetical protein C8R42DRAFT_684972 [Lentinula raphanica]KAJ3773398.1 hypothetical protein FB446DRAFT_771829 [Lentinula raphanica]KAJ3819262.1 hypothetical protein F5880DRAFT_1678371 [Lentinula raphanica]KAJ3833691.1 hypothetical protein F5878DRAFT_728677 [Lentinula raphanica]KAJ3966058.1 hypothetical protein EV361DRAFT_936800 [Lentinula raphanica]